MAPDQPKWINEGDSEREKVSERGKKKSKRVREKKRQSNRHNE